MNAITQAPTPAYAQHLLELIKSGREEKRDSMVFNRYRFQPKQMTNCYMEYDITEHTFRFITVDVVTGGIMDLHELTFEKLFDIITTL